MFYITYKNVSKGEYLKEVSPIIFTADVNEAYKTVIDINVSSYDETSTEIFKILEPLIRKEGIDCDWELNITNDNNETMHVEVTKSSIITKNINLGSNDESYFRMVIKDLTSYVVSLLTTLYMQQLTSKKGMSNALKSALGMNNSPFNSNESNGNVDELIDLINNETKGHVSKPNYTLDDYVCGDELKEELEEIKTFMEQYDKFVNLNIEIPKGIIFKGEPGTGKTYAAKCIAGATDCYFISCTASSLQSMYIGSGSQNIRELFMGAKKLQEVSQKGVIIFIDEIDSLGSRENHTGGAGGEEDRTVNQLLAEMDGFEETSRIMVMAATNYVNRLDDALLRSGRFSRQINIPVPNEIERQSLIKFYFNRIKMDILDTEESEIAQLTHGLVPADIKTIANESAILAVRYGNDKITLADIDEAINKCITKNIRNKTDNDNLEIVTAHECGHVLAEFLYAQECSVKVTNYSYGDAGGFTQPSFKLKGLQKKDDFINEIKILLGGRVAEEVICGTITNGASNDLEKAKRLLYNYYKTYNFEHYKAEELDQIVLDAIQDLYLKVLEDFKEHKKDLENLKEALYTDRTLYKKDIINILGAWQNISGGSLL